MAQLSQLGINMQTFEWWALDYVSCREMSTMRDLYMYQLHYAESKETTQKNKVVALPEFRIVTSRLLLPRPSPHTIRESEPCCQLCFVLFLFSVGVPLYFSFAAKGRAGVLRIFSARLFETAWHSLAPRDSPTATLRHFVRCWTQLRGERHGKGRRVHICWLGALYSWSIAI